MKRVVFPDWILRGLGGEELRVQPFDAPRPERWVLLPPMFVVGYMQGWLCDPDARRVLVDIYATLFGPLRLSGWSYDEIALAIGPPLRTAFERKDLIVLMPWRPNAPRPGPPREPTLPPPPPPAKDDTTWFEIQVVDEVNVPIGGLEMKLTVDGTARRITTDGAGVARVDQAHGGFGSAEVASIEALRALLKPRWQKPRKPSPPTGANVSTRQLEAPIAAVALENEVRAILVITPRFRCREVPGQSFLFGRSFPQRAALSVLSAVVQELQADNGLRGMIFGHTDIAGSTLLGKELSERRAKAVRALLTHDDALWNEPWRDTGGNAWHEKWGILEVQHILNTLSATRADGGGPLREDGVADQRTLAALGAYRAAPAGSTGSPLDDEAIKQLFLAYAKRVSPTPIDGATKISAIGDAGYMGCAEFNPLSLHAADAESRRVVVLTYDTPAEPQGLPCKLGTIAPCLTVTSPAKTEADPSGKPPYRCKVYTERASCCPAQPGPALGHDLVIVFPFAPAYITSLPHVLVLESDDGTVTRRAPLAQATLRDDGRCEVVFELLPEALLYRLRAEHVDAPYEIFPYTPWRDIPKLKIEPLPEARHDAAMSAVLVRDTQGGRIA